MMLPASGVTGQGSKDGPPPPHFPSAAPVPALGPLALVGGGVAADVGVPGREVPVLRHGAVAAGVPGVHLTAVSGPLVGGPLIGGSLVGVAVIRRWLLPRVLRIPHDCPSLPRTGSCRVAIVNS